MSVLRWIAAVCLLALPGSCSDTDAPSANPVATSGGVASTTGGSAKTGGADSTSGGRALEGGGSPGSGGSPTTGGLGSKGGTTGGASTPASAGGRVATGGNPSSASGGSPASGGDGSSGVTNGGSTTGAGGKGGNPGGGSAGSAHTGPWNVMMLGDSITASTCYPQLLSQQLETGGHTNFALVGTQTTNQGCSGAPAVKTEGHGGYGVTYLPANSTRGACTKSSGCGSYSELQQWAALKPDMVLMHYGTNDVWDGQTTESILTAYVGVIAEFRKQNPKVVFFVSKIIKLDPNGCANCASNVLALANAVTPDWASTNSLPESPVHVVNHYDSGFEPGNPGDTADGVHPTAAGAMKMAAATYAEVTAHGYF